MLAILEKVLLHYKKGWRFSRH